MTKSQILLVTGGIILVIVLYRLPRVVVENEADADIESHEFSVSPEDEAAIASLREELRKENLENYANFADSLARYYLKYGLADSAASISKRSLQRDSSLQNLKKAGVILYTVFERTVPGDEAYAAAFEAREVLDRILESEPENLAAKTRLAMTLVVTENPMAGIAMLREVVETDPDNREAIINLGLLSIQSGQYDKGIERFEALLEKDTADFEAMLYLGVCYLEVALDDRATELFEKIAEAEDADPALKAAAAEYLRN